MSACKIEMYEYSIKTPILLFSLAALPVVAAAPGQPQTSTWDFFFPGAHSTRPSLGLRPLRSVPKGYLITLRR